MDYASALALEVRQPAGSPDPVVRFNFKNGSDASFTTYPWLNQSSDVPLSTVLAYLQPVAVNTTEEWCKVCGNQKDRGCAAFYSSTLQPTDAGHRDISAVGAGFVGAGVTIAIFAAALAVLAFLGLLTFGRSNCKRRASRTTRDDASETYPLGVCVAHVQGWLALC